MEIAGLSNLVRYATKLGIVEQVTGLAKIAELAARARALHETVIARREQADRAVIQASERLATTGAWSPDIEQLLSRADGARVGRALKGAHTRMALEADTIGRANAAELLRHLQKVANGAVEQARALKVPATVNSIAAAWDLDQTRRTVDALTAHAKAFDLSHKIYTDARRLGWVAGAPESDDGHDLDVWVQYQHPVLRSRLNTSVRVERGTEVNPMLVGLRFNQDAQGTAGIGLWTPDEALEHHRKWAALIREHSGSPADAATALYKQLSRPGIVKRAAAALRKPAAGDPTPVLVTTDEGATRKGK